METNTPSAKSTIKKKSEKAALWYADRTELRTIVSLIPGIGSAIDLIFSAEAQKIEKRRIFEALNSLSQEMEKIDEKKIDKEFLSTEEFFDLLIRTFDYSVKTRFNEKIRLYSRILAGSVSVESQQDRESAEDFLNAISPLSLKDLIVAREIYRQQKDTPESFTGDDNEVAFINRQGWRKLPQILNMDDSEFKLSLINLSRAGLIRPIIITAYGYVGGNDYIITMAFTKLMNFISKGNSDVTLV